VDLVGSRRSGTAALEGILFVLNTGCRWRDLPSQLGVGSGHTAWRRLRAWQAAGVWDRLHQFVLDELSEADVLDWSRASIDAVSVRGKDDMRRDPLSSAHAKCVNGQFRSVEEVSSWPS
jgi:transposase